ncbi:MAG: large subunit ribosomal protein, partial [Acidobacteriota bacterium]|nr:large subunit ribosomal protein [Acidobacteriota bacterium]
LSNENIVDFDSVLLVQNNDLHIGQPFVKNARIRARILEEFKAPKIIVFKKEPKKQYKRTRGHRQKLHRIQIEKIELEAKEKE